MDYKNLTLVIFGIILFYLVFFKKEGMSNTDLDKRIKAIYNADIQSIRNLSKLANDLTSNGKLVVPGGLEILGNVTMRNNLYVAKQTTLNEIYGGKSSIHGFRAIQVNGGHLMFNAGDHGFGFHSNGNRYQRYKNAYSSHKFSGDGSFSGNGYFGPAYIGKYQKTNGDYAQFCHKDQAGKTNRYALLQYKNGLHTYLNTGKHIWFRQNNSTKMDLTNSTFKANSTVNIGGGLNVGGNLSAIGGKLVVYKNGRGSGEMSLKRENGRTGVYFTSNYTYKGNHRAGIWTYHGNGRIAKTFH